MKRFGDENKIKKNILETETEFTLFSKDWNEVLTIIILER